VKQRIAIIIPGGIGTGRDNIGVPVLERLVRLLSREFQITVFSLFKVNQDYRQNDFELISIEGNNRARKVLRLGYIFYQKHRQNKFTAVHGFWAMPSGLLAVVLGKLFSIKSLVSVLGGDTISLPEIRYGQLQRWSSRILIMWTLKNADVVISLTQYLVDNLRVFGLIRDMHIIPWGIETTEFSYQNKEINTPVQFLHIGNLSPVKDQVTLLKAFKIINTAIQSKLTIIGEGILESQIKALVVELELQDHVTFLGLLPYEVLPAYYQKADILLQTSCSEGQSEVVTEAMSSGTVVCGTKVGLVYDQPECCIGVAVKDFEKLGLEVLILLRDPGRFQTIREKAYTWALRHSIHWTVQMVSRLYVKSIGPKA
jgi:glycosyltransferase involved in cell wall biosynthesis